MEREILVNLNLIGEAQALCKLAEESEVDVKLCSDGYIVNGKSLLGMFSLDLSKPLTVRVNGTPGSVDDFVNKVISVLKDTHT